MRATPSSLNILTLFYKDDGIAIINTIKTPFFCTKIPTPNTYISPPIEGQTAQDTVPSPLLSLIPSTPLYPLLATKQPHQCTNIPSHYLSLKPHIKHMFLFILFYTLLSSSMSLLSFVPSDGRLFPF